MMRNKFQLFLSIIAAIIIAGFAAIALLVTQPHIPSYQEVLFRWKQEGEITSPEQLRKLTNFEWKKICITDEPDWVSENAAHSNYKIVFFDDTSRTIDTFYLRKASHGYLELHLNHCFLPEQKFFHKIEDYANPQHTLSEIFSMRMEQAKEQKKHLTLQDLTSFDWQKACFIPPYMIEADIQRFIGQEYRLGTINTGDDGLYNLLFLLPDKTTLAVQVPKVFYQLNARPCLTYEESKAIKLYY